MDQVLKWFAPEVTPYWIVLGALVITTVIVVPAYLVDYVASKRKKQPKEARANENDPPVIASKSKIKAQLKTLDKAPKGKVEWL